ncbi:MAG TPA: aldehyde dehydrogenase family protein [Solirubrobacteraceae bacterium]|nr:aldehyde dehydrogenase family protein [Solirubrobacteraceae bacterium]
MTTIGTNIALGGGPSSATDTIPVLDPATGEVLDHIPAGDPGSVDQAVRRARAAHPDWARTPPAQRGAALKAAAARARAHADELAELQTRENGKPLDDSRGGVDACLGAIEQYAELGPLHRGRALQGGWEAADLMIPEPHGVVALLVPWNDPLAIAGQGLAAALVTGNTVVLKPSERTPLATARLVELLDLPAGTLTLLLGDERAGRPLVEHEEVDCVLHTGSTHTGREIAQRCAAQLKKAVVELGGKDPLIVDAGVDPEWAADQAATGAFANAGQICTSVERILCHRDIAQPFLAALTRRASELRMGHGLEAGTQLGPLIDAAQRDLVARHVAEAVDAGARVLAGGAPADGVGFFFPATVLTDVPLDTALMREETFGPVAPVRLVDGFDEAIAAANATGYGLAATVLTTDQGHAQRAWRELHAGTVKVNAVFGGAPGGAAHPRRASGLGLGYGPELLDELTQVKVVHLEAAPVQPPS